MKDRPNRTRRVTARVTPGEYGTLCEIARRGGFVNMAALFKYTLYCLVRTFDAETKGAMEDVPEGLYRLFVATYRLDAAKLAAAARLVAAQQAAGAAQQAAGAAREDGVAEDVGDMFRECEEEGARLQWRGGINERL